MELDFSIHELNPFLSHLIKPNGNFIEQLYSPHVIITSETHKEIKKLSKGLFCKKLFFHYRDFARKTKEQGEKSGIIKKYLYSFRLYMAGINILNTGEVISDINLLNEDFRLLIVDELVEAKLKGELEKFRGDSENIKKCLYRLDKKLIETYNNSKLPENTKI